MVKKNLYINTHTHIYIYIDIYTVRNGEGWCRVQYKIEGLVGACKQAEIEIEKNKINSSFVLFLV